MLSDQVEFFLNKLIYKTDSRLITWKKLCDYSCYDTFCHQLFQEHGEYFVGFLINENCSFCIEPNDGCVALIRFDYKTNHVFRGALSKTILAVKTGRYVPIDIISLAAYDGFRDKLNELTGIIMASGIRKDNMPDDLYNYMEAI